MKWDEIWKHTAVDSEWLKEVKAEGDRLNNQLEAVKEFVLSRRDDIDKDMENFGILKPVLDYFAEAEK